MKQSSLSERLRARGWRMTRQRQAVVSVLDASPGHFSAEEVWAGTRGAERQISLATVYNTLTALAAMGELRAVRVGPGPIRFDPNITPHHHLVCDECGRLIDIAPIALSDVAVPASQRHGFVVEGVDVIIHGRCRDCAGSK